MSLVVTKLIVLVRKHVARPRARMPEKLVIIYCFGSKPVIAIHFSENECSECILISENKLHDPKYKSQG